MKKIMWALVLVGFALAPGMGRAETSTEKMPEKPSVPTLGAIMGASGIDFSGYIDATYTSLSGNGKFIGGVFNNRVFDFEPNSFNLQAIDVQISKLPAEGFGGLVNATLGKDADIIAAYGSIDSTKGPAGGVNKVFDLTQAYFHYAGGPLMVIAGKYVTLAGAEVIKGPGNANISRSILFGYAIPFTHTGMRATYKASDTLSLIAGVNNGWDDLKDTNKNKTLELGLALAPNSTFSLSAQAYSGVEQVTNYPLSPAQGRRDLYDLVATINATDKLALVLNYDDGSQRDATLINGATGTAKWDGWAGYANYQINEQWRLSLRGEIFNDKDGYRTVVGPSVAGGPLAATGQKWKEITLTVAHTPAKNIELRAEARVDRSDQVVFMQSNGSAKTRQNSLALEAIYKF